MGAKVKKLLEGINKDAKGGIEIKFLEGDNVEVTKYGKQIDVLELEKGDDIQECLNELMEDLDLA